MNSVKCYHYAPRPTELSSGGFRGTMATMAKIS